MKLFTNLKNKTAPYFISKFLPKNRQWRYFAFISGIAFVLRLLIYFNTTIFAFSDFAIYYSYAFKIAEGENIPLFTYKGPLVISFIGAWFIKNFGSINFWFYTNILLSSLSLLLAWQIIKKITRHSGIANLSVLLIAFYPVFVVQPAIFYTQVVMIFIESAIILLLILAYETRRNIPVFLYLMLSSALVVLSMFFKWELLYFYIFIGISSIVFLVLKYKRQALISLLFSLLTFIFLQITIHFYEPIQIYLDNGDNKLFFMGQTLYGGGEGVLLDEYAETYNKGLEEFNSLHKNEYENYIKLRNEYHIILIKDFITNHPFGWAGLQAKKFFRTLGVKPEGMSFRLLVSGRIPINKYSGGALLSLPFLFLFLCCIFQFRWDIVKKLFESYNGIFMITVFIYFVIAVIFYSHYQTRYRMPLDFFFIIPAAAALIVSAVSNGNTIKAAVKKHFKWKIIVFIIFLSAWTYEAYDIFYLNSERYVKNAEMYEEGIVP